jgi:hypothetical protein
MQMSRKLLVCAGLSGAFAAAACSRSPVAPSQADVPDAAVLGLGYGSGHRASAAAAPPRAGGRDSSVVVVLSGGLGYGSGH